MIYGCQDRRWPCRGVIRKSNELKGGIRGAVTLEGYASWEEYIKRYLDGIVYLCILDLYAKQQI